MKWTKSDKKKLRKLYPYKTDKELEKIFKRTAGTIRKQASELHIKKENHSPKITWNPSYSNELFYVLGVLEGDGYVERKPPHKIALGVVDKVFIDEFKKSVCAIGLTPSKHCVSIEPPKIRTTGFQNRKTLYRIRFYSKAFSNWYWNDFDYKLIIDNVSNEQRMFNFLKGIFESEGHLDKKSFRSSIYNTNRELIDICKMILEHYQLHPTLILGSNNGNLPYYRLSLNRINETKIFIEKIKPCLERKRL